MGSLPKASNNSFHNGETISLRIERLKYPGGFGSSNDALHFVYCDMEGPHHILSTIHVHLWILYSGNMPEQHCSKNDST